MEKSYLVLTILIVLFSVYWIFKALFRRETVFEYQTGLLYKDGKLIKELSPGSYWLSKISDRLQVVDTRSNNITIGAQEVLSKDNIGLKLSLAMNYKVDDAKKAINEYVSYYGELYSMVQIVTRNLVAAQNAEELLENRKTLGESITEEVKAKAQDIGVAVEQVEIKDIMFPNEIRKIFSEVVRAKKEAEASLERARGEQAALRSLANAARTIENNPALMNLRILQTFSNKSSDGVAPNIVLGMPQGLFPLAEADKKEN